VLRANPRSSALESHSSPGEHRATLHIAVASPAAAGSAGEPAASQPSRCVSCPALLSSLELNVCFLAWARWQQGSLAGVPHPWGGWWPGMAGAGRCHPQPFLPLSGAGDLFAVRVAATVPSSYMSLWNIWP